MEASSSFYCVDIWNRSSFEDQQQQWAHARRMMMELKEREESDRIARRRRRRKLRSTCSVMMIHCKISGSCLFTHPTVVYWVKEKEKLLFIWNVQLITVVCFDIILDFQMKSIDVVHWPLEWFLIIVVCTESFFLTLLLEALMAVSYAPLVRRVIGPFLGHFGNLMN